MSAKLLSDRSDAATERTTAHLKAAIREIDGAFGAGYAAANPTLVSAFVQSASLESIVLSGESVAMLLDTRADRSVNQLCAAMESLRPRLFG